MKHKPFKRAPVLIALGAIAFACLFRWFQAYYDVSPSAAQAGAAPRMDILERLERMTFDMRVRTAFDFHPPATTNLGFVAIDENSLVAVHNRSMGFFYAYPWPRQVYGRLVHELARQGAEAVAFDVILGETRGAQDPTVNMGNGVVMDSDDYFGYEMRQASNVVIALSEVVPPPVFRTNAMALGDISTEKDADGVLRRARVFKKYRHWNKDFEQLADQIGIDLDRIEVKPHELVIPLPPGSSDDKEKHLPLDANGEYDRSLFVDVPAGQPTKAKPFEDAQAWHMGVVLAAKQLGLDLNKAEFDLPHGRIILRGPGVERVLPVDQNGFMYINWCMTANDPRLARQPIEAPLGQAFRQLQGETQGLTNFWQGKLAVVGSSALSGNNVSDLGATSLSANTLLVSKHWNVANSIILGNFIYRTKAWMDVALIVFLGLIAALVTWGSRPVTAIWLTALALALYVVAAFALYIQTRYWIPLVLPLSCALLTHLSLVTWRVIFEQAEQRRVKAVFTKMVSPKIVSKLLNEGDLNLGGERREITVFFADVRGFTELTDKTQERVAEFVRVNNLTGAAAEAAFDKAAEETLDTVNTYLSLIADTIKKLDGTLDKFIGDCVMAFWGAPAPDPRHALSCVRAAIEAQRAMAELNKKRTAQNEQIAAENEKRKAAGQPLESLLPVLSLGSGINSGVAIAGLMGSTSAEMSYTVFGREVNLASRLEGASGRGHIYVSEVTYLHLKRDDPELAATCIELPERLKLKGFGAAVKVYEVPWHVPEPASAAGAPSQIAAPAPSEAKAAPVEAAAINAP